MTLIKEIVKLRVLIFFFACAIVSCKKKDSAVQETKPPVVEEKPVKTDVKLWLTNPDKSVLFKQQNVSLLFTAPNTMYTTIEVDTTQSFQTIDGFGYTLTGGSAMLINSLPEATQNALLEELFKPESSHIGVSYLRISIGASDLSDAPFTYNDLPGGQTDVNLSGFSIDKEKLELIPVLKKIIALSPNIKILGSPWSAPAWMKTSNSFVGGNLKPEYYSVYANYLVKYIQAMKAEGIIIDAITPQNEPLNGDNNPSMVMQAADEATFIRDHLGPAFENANLTTKIIVYDHNADNPNYPISILNDAHAKSFVDGSAFHLYAGSISALTTVHNAHPDKNVYFTEQWVSASGNFSDDLKWHIENLIIGAPRNWSRNVLEWNLAADPNNRPYTNGGCSTCLGALSISGSTVTRNVAYYIIAHASKFVRPGSVRIASNMTANLPNVAFKNPDGKKVLIVLNTSSVTESFNIKFNGRTTTASLNKGAVGTFVW